MPTIVGVRRRGFTPESIRLMCDRIGVTKVDSWIDMSVLEGALRDDLDAKAPRAIAVLDPLKLIIDNYPEGTSEACSAPVHPHHPERGTRAFPFSRELWIEREDFQETPQKGYFRLFPGNKVRLKYGFVVECTGADKDENGNVDRRPLQLLPRQQVGHRRREQLQGQGHDPLGQRGARVRGRSAHLRPAVQGTAAGRRRRGVSRRAQSGFEARRATRTWNRARAMPPPKTASSSSAMVISSPIASIRSRASRCSTGSSVCATVGASPPDMRPQGGSRGNERATRRARTIGFARASPTQRGA